MKSINLLLSTLLLSSCALITTPVKVLGSAAATTIEVTGKVVGAGVSHLGKDKEEPEEE